MNTGTTEILNQVMNRWVANFRSAQTTHVMNENTIHNLGIFNLHDDEFAILSEMNTAHCDSETSDILA